MEITLYKGCMLNKSYTEVFRSKELLNTYLNGLTKLSFTINPVNVQKSGTIRLLQDIYLLTQQNMFLYNYMKIDSGENTNPRMIVYAFIDRIYSQNEVMVYEYDTDVWHTYLGEWSLRKSIVSNSKRTIAGEPLEKPMSFIINPEYLKVKSLDVYEEGDDSKYDIVVKILLYYLTSGGEYRRPTFEGYVRFYGNAGQSGYIMAHINDDNISDYLNMVTNSQVAYRDPIIGGSGGNWKYEDDYGVLFSDLYCSVLEVYVIPKKWNIQRYFYPNRKIDYEPFDTSGARYGFERFIPNIDLTTLKIYSLPAYDGSKQEDTILGYGIFTNQLNYEYDGIIKNLEVCFSMSEDDIAFYLRVNGRLVEINEQFSFYQDYKPQTPDVLAQREIARKTETIKGMVSFVQGAAQLGLSVAGIPTISGSKNAEKLFAGANKLSRFNQPEAQDVLRIGKGMNYGSELSGVSSALSGSVNGISSMIEGAAQIKFANEKKYMSFNPTNNNSNAILNAHYSICYTYVEYVSALQILVSIPNFIECLNYINEVGYNVDYVTDDLDIAPNSDIMINPIKFSFVRLSGLSIELNNEIADILLNGTKIYYTQPS